MSSPARGANKSKKSQAQAEYMKERGTTRNSGACPWGCGAQITNGGQALMNHLNRCEGGGAKKRQRLLGGGSKRKGKR